MTRSAARVLALVAVLGSARAASAEDGLFITRISGGVSTMRPDMPNVGMVWNASMDLMITERVGIIGSGHWVSHDEARTVGLGLGVKALLVETMWTRIYLNLSPELLWVWRDDEDRRLDVAGRAELGLEHLFMWGFGYVIELHGTAPAGRGSAEPLDAASVGFTVGLFMEF